MDRGYASPPSRPLPPVPPLVSLLPLWSGARFAREFFSLSPSLPLFLSSPSSRPLFSLLPPLHLPSPAPHLPPPSYPVRPRRYFCMHTSKFSVSLHSPVIMKVHVQSLPLDDFADCLGNIKVVHRSYTFCICTEQPYPWHVFQYTPTFVKSVKVQMCVKIFWLEVTTCIKRTPMFNKLIFFISLKYSIIIPSSLIFLFNERVSLRSHIKKKTLVALSVFDIAFVLYRFIKYFVL